MSDLKQITLQDTYREAVRLALLAKHGAAGAVVAVQQGFPCAAAQALGQVAAHATEAARLMAVVAVAFADRDPQALEEAGE